MSSAFKNFAARRGAWLLVGLTLLFVLVVRVRLREMPLERDEGEYAYAGQLILHGVPPYQQVYNMKLPGTYAAYAVIMAVLGQTPAGIHLGVMLVNLGSIVLVFLIGRKLLDETTGVVAAAAFAVMSLSPYVLGLAGHATHFVTFFALVGVLVLLRACAEKAESGSQEAEERGQRTEDGGRRTEDGGRRTEDRGQRTEDGGRRTEDGGRRTEDRGQRTEDSNTARSAVRSSEFEVQGSRFVCSPPACSSASPS
jgi:hypothetical protein